MFHCKNPFIELVNISLHARLQPLSYSTYCTSWVLIPLRSKTVKLLMSLANLVVGWIGWASMWAPSWPVLKDSRSYKKSSLMGSVLGVNLSFDKNLWSVSQRSRLHQGLGEYSFKKPRAQVRIKLVALWDCETFLGITRSPEPRCLDHLNFKKIEKSIFFLNCFNWV